MSITKDQITKILTPEFINTVCINEGSKQYQAKRGFYRNAKFYPYKDSLGFYTIGYGHYIGKTLHQIEHANFINGLNDTEALQLLHEDLENAINEADDLFDLEPHPLTVQHVLIEMIFQLGYAKASRFVKFKWHIKAHEYTSAGFEMKNSLWYKQTPNRVLKHVQALEQADSRLR